MLGLLAEPTQFNEHQKDYLRHDYIMYAASSTERCVALFCDYPTDSVRKQDFSSNQIVMPQMLGVTYAIARARQLASLHYSENDPRPLCIVLLRTTASANIKKDIDYMIHTALATEEVRKTLRRVEMWSLEELRIPILDHVNMSKYEKCASPLQIRFVPGQLSLMLVSDPVARWLGLDVGDIVAIHRVDSRFGPCTCYRRVVRAIEHCTE